MRAALAQALFVEPDLLLLVRVPSFLFTWRVLHIDVLGKMLISYDVLNKVVPS